MIDDDWSYDDDDFWESNREIKSGEEDDEQ